MRQQKSRYKCKMCYVTRIGAVAGGGASAGVYVPELPQAQHRHSASAAQKDQQPLPSASAKATVALTALAAATRKFHMMPNVDKSTALTSIQIKRRDFKRKVEACSCTCKCTCLIKAFNHFLYDRRTKINVYFDFDNINKSIFQSAKALLS